tara:strand:+ start:437 stop:550 length:114 start_codon:yes stop_codon:yes gene_type:complete
MKKLVKKSVDDPGMMDTYMDTTGIWQETERSKLLILW